MDIELAFYVIILINISDVRNIESYIFSNSEIFVVHN